MNPHEYVTMYQLEDTHWWFLAKRLFITSLLPKTSNRMSILDLGAGTGGMTSFLQTYGNVTAIENSPDALPFLTKRKLNTIELNIQHLNKLPAKSYDMICLFDVLYHKKISSDTNVLSDIYTLLAPGGKLLITDSAIPWLFSKHDVVMHARQRYTLRELSQKIESCGFVIQRKTYLYFFTFPVFLLIRLLNKWIQLSNVAPVNPLINRMLLIVCKLEALLLIHVSFPIGSSVCIMATK